MGKKTIVEVEIDSEVLAYYSKQENPVAYISNVLEEHASRNIKIDKSEDPSDTVPENYSIKKSEQFSTKNITDQKPASVNKDNQTGNSQSNLSSIAKKDADLFHLLSELGVENLNRFEWITEREFENFKGFTSAHKSLIRGELGTFKIVLGAARLRPESLFQFPALSKSKSLNYYENYFSRLLNKLRGAGWLSQENIAPIEFNSRPDRNLIKVWLILNSLIKKTDFDTFWRRIEDAGRLFLIHERYQKKNLLSCPATLNNSQFAAEVANEFDRLYGKIWLNWSGNKLAEDCGLKERTWIAILNDLEKVKYHCVEKNLMNPQRQFTELLKEIRNFSFYSAGLV